jgi:periplasmic mercuric ion binding protein
MRKLLASVALWVVAALSIAADGPATVTLAVGNMTCSLCPVTVKKSLERVHGVVSAKADLATQSAVVRYDPKLTDPQALVQATTRAGYPSKVK